MYAYVRVGGGPDKYLSLTKAIAPYDRSSARAKTSAVMAANAQVSLIAVNDDILREIIFISYAASIMLQII